MMKKSLSVVALGAVALTGAVVAPADAAVAPTSVDVYTNATSFAPVPGLATIGQLYLGNAGSASGNLPSGTRFYVTVEDMSGAPVKNTSLTLTTPMSTKVKIARVNAYTFMVTLRGELGPGEQIRLDWAHGHYLNHSKRNKIVVTTDYIPDTAVDSNPANNTSVYNNYGQGI
ncbi:hypothetical protein ACFP6B_08840 [Rothia nasimurium]|uniref:hypothetical protein n=1 Tax=Rothia nasimurium TaxID=85336 RepID=UPI003620097E